MQYTFSTRRDFLRNAVMLAGAGVTAPLMAAIIYWDLSDAYSWTATHVGSLCRRDMSPKPAYNIICDLFGREWRTNFERDVGGGRLSFRGFRGTYEVEAMSNGRTVRREFHVGAKNPETVVLV